MISVADGIDNRTALMSTASVLIHVIDLNDNTPVLSVASQLSLPESTAVGSVLTTASATDADSGLNGQFVFSLDQGSPYFRINSSTGELSTAEAFDYEQLDTYNVVVRVSDLGSSSLSNSSAVQIAITDVNDNVPVFDDSFFLFSLAENATIGDFVGQVSGSDRDSGANALLSFAIDTVGVPFAINAMTGELTLSETLDREQTDR